MSKRQAHRISWPLTPNQVEAIDEMFETLFKVFRKGTITLDSGELVSGVLPPNHGGTGIGTYAVGDLIVADAVDSLANLPDVATGNVLLSGGLGAPPSYGKVPLSTHVTGDLPLTNIAQGSALSVLGVAGNVTADEASIVAASDHQVLRRSGTVVGFGAVDLAQSAAVTGDLPFANVVPASGASVLVGRGSAAGAGDFQEVTLGAGLAMTGTVLSSSGGGGTNALLDATAHTDTVAQAPTRGSLIYGNSTPKWDELVIGATNRVLRSDGTDVVWAQVALATDVSGDLPFANLAQVAASKLLGRGSAGGTGDAEEITVGSGLTMTGTTLSASGGGSGDVVGPASSTNNHLAAFDGVTGKLLRDITLGTNLSITGTTLNATGGGGSGDVVGPASSTDNHLAAFDGVTGKLLRDITLGTNLSITGTTLNAAGGGGGGLTVYDQPTEPMGAVAGDFWIQ